MNITKIKFANEEQTFINVTTDKGDHYTNLNGSTWLHEEIREWMKTNTPEPYMTEEELYEKHKIDSRNSFKEKRKEKVDAIKITIDDLIFDGDEISQERMARACVGMNDEETIMWTLADNSKAEVTKETLRTVLRMAGSIQTSVW